MHKMPIGPTGAAMEKPIINPLRNNSSIIDLICPNCALWPIFKSCAINAKSLYTSCAYEQTIWYCCMQNVKQKIDN